MHNQISPGQSVASTSFNDLQQQQQQPQQLQEQQSDNMVTDTAATPTSIMNSVTATVSSGLASPSRTSTPVPNESQNHNTDLQNNIIAATSPVSMSSIPPTSPSNTSSVLSPAGAPGTHRSLSPTPNANESTATGLQDQTSNVPPISPPSTPNPSSEPSSSVPTSPQSYTHSMESATSPTVSTTILHETKDKFKQDKKERHATKKLIKELASCKTMLEEMEVSEKKQSSSNTTN